MLPRVTVTFNVFFLPATDREAISSRNRTMIIQWIDKES